MEQKKLMEEPQVVVLRFDAADVIATSGTAVYEGAYIETAREYSGD